MMKHDFIYNGVSYAIELKREPGGFRARFGDEEVSVVVSRSSNGRLELQLDDRIVRLHTAAQSQTCWVALEGQVFELRRETRGRRSRPGAVDSPEGTLRAPMPGKVRSVDVAVGDEVEKGQPLLLLEAMKMEIRIQSPCDGIVSALPVAVGDQVDKDQVMVEVR